MFKVIFKKILEFFGISKESKFVSNYLNESNVRSGLFMGAVVIILETWLIIRQVDKYIIPYWEEKVLSGNNNGLEFILTNIGQYVLFFLVGAATLVFAITYHTKKIKNNTKFVLLIAFGVALALFCIYGFFVKYRAYDSNKNIIYNILTILLYLFSFFLGSVVILHAVNFYFKKTDNEKLQFSIIILFSLICLAFGVLVSYSDHISSKHKEIICFLSMVIYVACLLIWKPWISILMNGAIFLGFYFLLHAADVERGLGTEDQLAFKDGDVINYITFFISLVMVSIMLYHQRRNAARKDEELDYAANYDLLTGLHNFPHFINGVEKYQLMTKDQRKDGEKIIIFININDFKLYNDQKGFLEGNTFLTDFGQTIQTQFSDSIVCRQSDDHYILFTDTEGFLPRIEKLHDTVLHLDPIIEVITSFGGYKLSKNYEDTRRMVDKARYACSIVTNKKKSLYLEYDLSMHQGYHQMQYIIHNVDKAIENNWIKPYYQPLAYTKTMQLCGLEALARWIDPKYGFLSPASFVPTLEANKLIHKIDRYIMECVCKDIRFMMENKLPVAPISINMSRLDFELMDAVKALDDVVRKYDIPKKYFHIEITESALMDNTSLLSQAIKVLKEKGYSLWLDDFGNGYSSLNVLKDFEFDVLKVDMVFLKDFEMNSKAKRILKAVMDMAKALGMSTLTEGVETDDQRDFLASVGCERVQGYLIGKPMPIEDLISKLDQKVLVVDPRELK